MHLKEHDALNEELKSLTDCLSAVLERFSGYDRRFENALRRTRGGENDWVDKTTVDSCHRVWFQLHEDFVATLGIDGGREVTR